MCFSYEASVISLLVGTISSTAVFLLGSTFDKIMGAWFFYISLMQGVDAVLWKHQTCDAFHKSVSYWGSVLNSSQPLILGILVLLFNRKLSYPGIVGGSMALVAGYGIYKSFVQHPDSYYCTQPHPTDPHLVWNWTTQSTYMVDWLVYLSSIYVVSLLGLPTLTQGVLFSNGMLVGLLVTGLVYPRESIGSLWCYFTALTPPFYLAYRTMGYTI